MCDYREMPRYKTGLFVVLLALCATLSAEDRPDFLEVGPNEAYRLSGEFANCLSLSQVNEIRVLDRERVLFRLGVSRYYLNTLPRPCHALARDSVVSLETRSARVCDIDWLRVHRPFDSRATRARGPACGLGRFERLEHVERALDELGSESALTTPPLSFRE